MTEATILSEFESFLSKQIEVNTTDVTPKIAEGIKYCLFGNGKRIRPVLLLAACNLFSEPGENAFFFALGVECYHTFTLVHDDLPCMDDDDFRRGKPSCHKVFGEGQAVLIGDALQDLAYTFILKAIALSDNIQATLKAAEIFNRYVGASGLIGGQSLDIDPDTPDTLEYLKRIHKHKTCDLFCASVIAGALLGGADEKNIEFLHEFAVNYGYVFQITDDLLDTGKNEDRSIFKFTDHDEIHAILTGYADKAANALVLLNKNTEFFDNLLTKTITRTN